MKNLRKTSFNALFLLSLGSLCGALSGCGNGGGAQAKEAEKAAVNAVPVEVATVGNSPIDASYNGTASLVADHEAQVASKATGVLIKVLVEEGQTVQQGQLLAELDNSTATASVAQAEAQMNKADATFAYAEQSIKKQLISKREYDQANFDMQTQKAALQTARLQLAYTRITAPVNGVIAERSVKLGNLIQVNQNLFRIVGMDPLQAVLNVPERQLGILKARQAVQLEADALPGKKFAGNILRIAPVVDPASGTFRVTCEFHDKTGLLKPGMFGRIDIVYDHREEALTVPRSALIEEDGETAVFVVDAAPVKPVAAANKDAAKPAAKDGKDSVVAVPGFVAHRKLVKVGYSDGDKVEIRSGIDAGTRVITVGRNAVRDGTAVQVLETELAVAQDGGSKGVNIVEAATRRRVTVGMVTLTFVLFGLIALSGLKVNLLPDLSYPTLTVRTEYEGAAPMEIENLISKPVEEAIGVVKNLRKIHSVSRAGQSDVILEFAWGTNMDQANLDVRDKLDVLQLPLEAKKPVLLRFNPSTDPIMRLALTSSAGQAGTELNEAGLKQLRRFADDELKKRLEPTSGVAAVKVGGGLEDQVDVDIDQHKLQQLNLNVADVVKRLADENVNVSGGRIENGSQRYLVRTVNQFGNLDEMRSLLIKVDKGVPVRLADIAEVRQGYKEREGIVRVDGREAIELAVYKEGDANTVSVANGVKKQLARLTCVNEGESCRPLLPANAKLDTIDDQSIFIQSSLDDVRNDAVIGGILAILIIFFFLADSWSTFIISLSLPISLIATFFFMGQAGVSLNVMSLGGLALATGMVVDDSIVVLENIARLREQGLGIVAAAVKGAREVSMAVIASTLTTVAVFFPLVFVQGVAGQLFRDQALTVTFAMLISLVVAMTLIPMLASLRGRSPIAYKDEAPDPESLGSKILGGAKSIVVWPFRLERPSSQRTGLFIVMLPVTLFMLALYVPLLLVVLLVSAIIRYGAISIFFATGLLLGRLQITLDYARQTLRWGIEKANWPARIRSPRVPRVARIVLSALTKLVLLPITLVAVIFAVLLPAVLVPVGWSFRKLLGFSGKVVLSPYNAAARAYHGFLPKALAHPSLVLGFAVIAFVASVLVIPTLGMDLIPSLAQGRFEMNVRMPPGTPLADTDALVRELQQKNAQDPNIKLIYGVSGTGTRLDANPTDSGENIARMLVVLKPGVGDKGEHAATEALRATMRSHPGSDVKFQRPALFSFATPLEIELRGYDLASLEKAGKRLSTLLNDSPRFADVKSTVEGGYPEIQIHFDQERAAALGLTTKQIADQVVNKVRGSVATRYSFHERKIDVLVRAQADQRGSVEDVRNLVVGYVQNTAAGAATAANPASTGTTATAATGSSSASGSTTGPGAGTGTAIRLSAVADVVATQGPSEIHRISQERVAILSANLRYGDLGSAVAEVRKLIAANPLAAGVSTHIGGQSEELDASVRSLMFALALAIFLVYLVMASQFESLLHPFVIMFSIPLALVGAVLALKLTFTPLSVVVFIGLIMLAGIVVKNAIVLIDRVNQLREEGVDKLTAIARAAESRLRPITMTTLCTLIGFMPLAIGWGDGSEVRAPMAITVIGGLLVSTLLTLVVIPVVYTLLDRRGDEVYAERGARKAEALAQDYALAPQGAMP